MQTLPEQKRLLQSEPTVQGEPTGAPRHTPPRHCPVQHSCVLRHVAPDGLQTHCRPVQFPRQQSCVLLQVAPDPPQVVQMPFVQLPLQQSEFVRQSPFTMQQTPLQPPDWHWLGLAQVAPLGSTHVRRVQMPEQH